MRYCAFLRGVNVKGTTMKMAKVCTVFSDAGMSDVSSVLASGNIIFSSDDNPEILKKILEKALSDYFDYEAFLFIKSDAEIIAILKNNSFDKNAELHHYAFVGNDGIEKILLTEFEKTSHDDSEKAQIVANNFYWQIAKGNTLNSEFGKILGRKNLRDQFTSRNINTFEKILNKISIHFNNKKSDKK
jgi:uncharacterized protein (DUF1697 family)